MRLIERTSIVDSSLPPLAPSPTVHTPPTLRVPRRHRVSYIFQRRVLLPSSEPSRAPPPSTTAHANLPGSPCRAVLPNSRARRPSVAPPSSTRPPPSLAASRARPRAGPRSTHPGLFRSTSEYSGLRSLALFLTYATGRATHIGGTSDFNVVFIGAGNIMFGAQACHTL